MKFKNYIFIFFAITISCKSYTPFADKKEKKEGVRNIEEYVNISNDEFALIKDNDSLLFELSLSVKDSVKPKLIERRLDSLFNGDYNKNELITMLKVDRVFGDGAEFDRKGKFKGAPSFESAEEAKEYVEELSDKILSNSGFQKVTRPINKKHIIGSWLYEQDSVKTKWVFNENGVLKEQLGNEVVENYNWHLIEEQPNGDEPYSTYSDFYLKLRDTLSQNERSFWVIDLNEKRLKISGKEGSFTFYRTK